ncbi:class I SAM-dependent methyltransferase [Pullulanibacillus sp. KACC 23026]|uniref:class I SAM-dependent methyltransferase n=1 Tax=Pullulanibacillus sp. KACC 23026 TaxID=3028315 RepID=UPI0023B0F05A|nr:class I SAM-dependent methyltransferase [Pullulanibacillus sp. KACC 23026]WEG12682.1 class I SAM-dependent methyltransferase [Pullulanibacillus sp. KACC 23026]
MSQHYYSQTPKSESHPNNIQVDICGLKLKLITDAGVFSKNGLDYGSRTLLEAFREPDGVKGPLLDIGCGYGPIGITLSLLYPERPVTMIDVNERAVQLAKKNAEANQSNANVLQSNLFENVHGTYAAIISNPPIRAGKEIVHQILENSSDYLLEGGELWVVIQKKQGAPSAIKKLEMIYQDVEIKKKDKGYYVICAKR